MEANGVGVEEESDKVRCIHGLAMVSSGSVYSSSLTPWPAEAWAAFQWHHKPKDAFTLHVQAIFVLHEPFLSHDCENGDGLVTDNPRYKQPVFFPHLPRVQHRLGFTGGEETSVETVVRQWGGLAGEDDATINVPAVALSPDEAARLMTGSSSTLFLLVRWCRFFLSAFIAKISYPPTEWALQHLRDAEDRNASQEVALTSDALGGFLQQVRCMWRSYLEELSQEVQHNA